MAKALLDAKNQQGYRSDVVNRTSGENRQKCQTNSMEDISGDSRQKYSARALAAEFFNVSEYEIRKAIKLTRLISELQDILENTPKHLNLAGVDWQIIGTDVVGDSMAPATYPTYQAVATYSGKTPSKVATGYTATAEYQRNIYHSGVDSIT